VRSIRIDDQGAIVHVVLDRPEARNALDLPMCTELREAFEALDDDAEVRAVLVRGTGVAFCAGADLKERQDRDADWVRARRKASFAAYSAIERCRVPVIGLVHGAVVGSGAEIALACDFAIAADDATFRFPETRWGTVGATQRLQRAIGRRRAKELLFTNRVLSALEAERLGLVVSVVPADSLLDTGADIAANIAALPPLALALTKRAVDLGGEVDLDSGIRIELAAIEQSLADDGWRAGLEEFNHHHGRADRRV